MSQQNTQQGVGLNGLLFIVFLVLKLTGYITWSWWYVTAPLWGPLALLAVIVVIWLLFIGLRAAFRHP